MSIKSIKSKKELEDMCQAIFSSRTQFNTPEQQNEIREMLDNNNSPPETKVLFFCFLGGNKRNGACKNMTKSVMLADNPSSRVTCHFLKIAKIIDDISNAYNKKWRSLKRTLEGDYKANSMGGYLVDETASFVPEKDPALDLALKIVKAKSFDYMEKEKKANFKAIYPLLCNELFGVPDCPCDFNSYIKLSLVHDTVLQWAYNVGQLYSILDGAERDGEDNDVLHNFRECIRYHMEDTSVPQVFKDVINGHRDGRREWKSNAERYEKIFYAQAAVAREAAGISSDTMA